MCTAHSQRGHNAKQAHNPSQTWPRPVSVLFCARWAACRTCLWLNLVTSTPFVRSSLPHLRRHLPHRSSVALRANVSGAEPRGTMADDRAAAVDIPEPSTPPPHIRAAAANAAAVIRGDKQASTSTSTEAPPCTVGHRFDLLDPAWRVHLAEHGYAVVKAVVGGAAQLETARRLYWDDLYVRTRSTPHTYHTPPPPHTQ